jgi:hypothetical protein
MPRMKYYLGMIGVLLVLAVLFVLNRPPGDRVLIDRTILAVATSSDPSYCETKVTPRYLEQVTAAQQPFADDICEREAGGSRASSVDTSDVVIDGDHATAVVSNEGGSFDGSSFVVRLVKEDGYWKLDRLVAFRHFDRAGFDRAYRRSFLEFGSPSSSADCALSKDRRLSDVEIERATLTGDLRPAFERFFVACDRGGAERSLTSAISEPDFGLPPRAIRCATDKIKSLSNAELVRVQTDLVTYGKLLDSCGRGAIFAHTRRGLSDMDLEPGTVDCVLDAFRARPPAAAIRLSYDQDRYNELIDGCE